MSLIEIYRNRVSEDVEPKLRRKAKEILRAYRHSWDIFSELIQNSVDAINRRYRILNEPDFYLYNEFRKHYNVTAQPSYRGIIKIKIDVLNKVIQIEDNGVGIEAENLERFLLPEESGKVLGKEYGFKGYGLTFAAFISREFQIKSKFFVSSDTSEVNLNGLFDWLVDPTNTAQFPDTPNSSINLPLTQSVIDGEKCNTVIRVRLEEDYKTRFPAIAATDAALTYIEKPEHWKRLQYILRSRTAIGNTRSLFNQPPIVPIDVSVTVLFPDNTQEERNLPYEFYHPREHDEIKSALYDFADYAQKFPQASFNRNFRGLYHAIMDQSIGARNPIQCDIAILAASSTRLSNIESDLMLDQVEAVDVGIFYGIHLSIDGMPTGIRIDDWDIRGNDRKRYYVIVDARLGISEQLDPGRKGISDYFTNLISDRVWELIRDERLGNSDTFSRYAVRFLDHGRAMNPLPTQTQEFQQKVNDIKQETQEQDKVQKDLLQLVIDHTSLLHFPTDEQEVILMFYSLLSKQVIKGYKTVYLSSKATYDAAFDYEIECTASNVYPEDALGVGKLLVEQLRGGSRSTKITPKYVHKERFAGLTKSAELCVEFKPTLGDFLKEVVQNSGKTNKNPNDIDLLIAWDDMIPSSISSASYTLAEAQDNQRIFHATTHKLGLLGTHHTEIYCIVLKKVLERVKA